MNMITKTGFHTNVNIRIGYDLRLLAQKHELNISEIARRALREEVARHEENGSI